MKLVKKMEGFNADGIHTYHPATSILKQQVMFRSSPVLLLLMCWSLVVMPQERYYTKTAKITFLSQAPMENIEAVNKTAGLVLDTRSGVIQSAVLMRGFEFKKALMQEHFNENYVESHKYPRAQFAGTITDNMAIDYSKDGTRTATIKGQLTIHGVTKEITAPVTLKIQGGKIEASSVFSILLSDYRIAIPAVVRDNISNTVKINIEAKLEPLKQ